MLRSSPSAQDADQRRSSERLRVGWISLNMRKQPLFCQGYVGENRAIEITRGPPWRIPRAVSGCGKRMRPRAVFEHVPMRDSEV